MDELPIDMIKEILLYLDKDTIYNVLTILDLKLDKWFYLNKLHFEGIRVPIEYLDRVYLNNHDYLETYSRVKYIHMKSNKWKHAIKNNQYITLLDILLTSKYNLTIEDLYTSLIKETIEDGIYFFTHDNHHMDEGSLPKIGLYCLRISYIRNQIYLSMQISMYEYTTIPINTSDVYTIIFKIYTKGFSLKDIYGNKTYNLVSN